MPGYDRLLIDKDGNVWARPHSIDRSKRCWHVFIRDPSGCAKVCLPDDILPLDIGRSAMLGVVRDRYNAEYVARYQIVKAK